MSDVYEGGKKHFEDEIWWQILTAKTEKESTYPANVGAVQFLFTFDEHVTTGNIHNYKYILYESH